MIIQFCGLSGAGKTTLARLTEKELTRRGYTVEIIDGDYYRETLCKGLDFSKEDRKENLRRMSFVAAQLSKHGIISIICAINPFEETRKEISRQYAYVKTVFVDCTLSALRTRDPKGLYRKAFLPDDHPEKIKNLTGVNDIFEIPQNPDLHIQTDKENVFDCMNRIVQLVEQNISLCSDHAITRDFNSELFKAG